MKVKWAATYYWLKEGEVITGVKMDVNNEKDAKENLPKYFYLIHSFNFISLN